MSARREGRLQSRFQLRRTHRKPSVQSEVPRRLRPAASDRGPGGLEARLDAPSAENHQKSVPRSAFSRYVTTTVCEVSFSLFVFVKSKISVCRGRHSPRSPNCFSATNGWILMRFAAQPAGRPPLHGGLFRYFFSLLVFAQSLCKREKTRISRKMTFYGFFSPHSSPWCSATNRDIDTKQVL